jgi:hypothetical protein
LKKSKPYFNSSFDIVTVDGTFQILFVAFAELELARFQFIQRSLIVDLLLGRFDDYLIEFFLKQFASTFKSMPYHFLGLASHHVTLSL